MAPIRKSSGGCCAINCSKRKGTNLLSKIKMFHFPRDPARRAAWTSAVKREDWVPTDFTVICSDHFITGQPSKDPRHPDYVPSIFSFKREELKDKEKPEKKIRQIYVGKYRKNVKRMRHDSISETSSPNKDPAGSSESNMLDVAIQTDLSCKDIENLENLLKILEEEERELSKSNMHDVAVQTDTSNKYIENLEQKLKILEEENSHLRKTTYDMVVNHNQKTFQFYTGIKNRHTSTLKALKIWTTN